VEAELQVDKACVFVIAASDGSPLARRLACDLSDEIAAVASISGAMELKDDCKRARPVSILAMHGPKIGTFLPGEQCERGHVELLYQPRAKAADRLVGRNRHPRKVAGS
jgi:poly(3-hydroxybutyrate) depolymerase